MADETAFKSTLTPQDSLPPVEPPSMKFIVQLFVIPGVIVLLIVLVWFGLNLLTRGSDNPYAFVDAIRRNTSTRWQAAHNLNHMLLNTKDSKIRSDEKLAGSLIQILEDEMKNGGTADKAVDLRIYLCSALGEFEVPTPLPILIEALKNKDQPANMPVRDAALQAIVKLMRKLREGKGVEISQSVEHNALETILVTSNSENDSDVLRSHAAFALGVLGGDRALERLKLMVGDGYPDARFNAATGLAKYGLEECQTVLLEMLDPDVCAGIEVEKLKEARQQKKDSIHTNAVHAVGILADKNTRIDLAPFIEAMEVLQKSLPNRAANEVGRNIAVLKEKNKARKAVGTTPEKS